MRNGREEGREREGRRRGGGRKMGEESLRYTLRLLTYKLFFSFLFYPIYLFISSDVPRLIHPESCSFSSLLSCL